MRSFSSISAGLLAFVLAGEALAASPALFRRAGSFTSSDLSVSAGSSPLTLEKAARQIALAEVPDVGVVSLGVAKAVLLGNGERVVRLPQVHQGVPVVSRGVAVTFGIDNAARLITSKLEVDLPSSVVPQTTAETAALVASKFTGLTVDSSRAVLAIWPTADGAKLVWVVAPTAIVGLPTLPVTVVDATTSDVVLAYDALRTLNQAKMYPTNPTKSPTTIDVTLPVGAGMTNLTNSLVKSYTCIDDHKLKSIPGVPISIHMCSLFQTATPDMNGDYLIQPAADTAPEDSFAEVSIFYHANRAYEFFRTFDPMLAVDPNILTTVSNLRMPDGMQTNDIAKLTDPNLPLVPFQNAFFAPQDPTFSAIFGINGAALWFGQGPLRDYSYDGDVIYHEFTHAVVDVTLQLVPTPHFDEYGASVSPGAMNEGLSDYFSSAIAGDPDVGEYAVGDFGAGMAAIRSLTNPDKCPSAVGGEVHQDATMFSASLWDVRKSLNAAQQAEFDQAVFTAMNSSATGDLAYEEFGQLVMDAVTASPLGQGVADQLKSAFSARGLFPKCTRVLEYKGAPLSGPPELQSAWFSLGTSTTGIKSAEGYTVGVVQVHLPLAANTNKINVAFKGQDIGGLGGGTAFNPGVLFHFGDQPLMFGYGPLAPKNGATFVATTKSGSNYTASVDVPAGTANAYVMIVNKGQNDGVVTQLALTTELGAGGTGGASGSGGMAGTGGMSGTGGMDGTGGTGGGGGNNVNPEADSGCGCSVPGTRGHEPLAALGALSALALIASRRRGKERMKG